ncbi:TetR/AcrR family transcriptional regulator [Pseudonocardia endophytica]|uniref:TetR family transcriptional regulator n=1 Tax=Pseudonocardia endophytica TaxID=401976 RepID=A0A4R1HN32_PSEEN|nr:TetR family transcriptional regulator [Pseudonocardia endophytica]TCK22483.1 TetR family transcriptional regulator [Pseudonocardia endophytica]
MTGETDGRRARGDRRRELLLDAAMDVIAAGGAGAVTHRAVAARAGVPAAAPGYYFPRVDDILVAALTRAGRRYELAVEDAARTVRDGGEPVAALAAAVQGWDGRAGDAAMAAEYELYLLAARRPELAPVALGWADRLTTLLVDAGAGPAQARAVVALVEGVLLQSLLGRTLPADELAAALRRLLSP